MFEDVLDSLNYKVRFHVSVECGDISSEEKMVRVYRKITDFVDKVIGIFDVSWMADGEWLKEVVNEFADFGRFRGAIRYYRASSRHMWIGPGRTSFVDLGEEVEVTRLSYMRWNGQVRELFG